MKLLKKIIEKDFSHNPLILPVRETSRAILLDKNNLIPLLFISKHNYHKLPGGVVEKGETKEESLLRECLEEVGSKVEISGELGKIIEFREKKKIKQISYGFYGKILSKGKTNFTKNEIKSGFQLKWFSLKEAISILRKDVPLNDSGIIVLKRDLTFLKEFEKLKVNQNSYKPQKL